MKNSTMTKTIMTLAGVALAAASSAQAGDTEWGGFAAPEFKYANKAASNKGFNVADGAFYVNHKEGHAKFILDIPFAYAASAGTFTLGANKAQAFVHVAYDSGFNWRLGQFDTLHGFEKKDLKDIHFAEAGFLDTHFSTTNTGTSLGYDGGSWGVDLVFANPAGATDHINSTTVALQKKYEYSLHTEWLRGQMVTVNFGIQALNKILTWDAIVGFGFGKVDANLEIVAQTGGASTGFGLLGQVMTDFNDDISGGIRLEYGSKLASNGVNTTGATTDVALAALGYTHSEFAATIGPQFKLSKAMKLKVDYTFDSKKATSAADSVSTHSGVVGAVYSF